MNITLRKANALQSVITDAIKAIQTEAIVRINEFQEGEPAIVQARDTLLENVNRKVNLTKALYAIRKEVCIANVSASIDIKLTDAARIEKEIQIYTGLAGFTVREPEKVVEGKLNKIRDSIADRSLYNRDEVVTGVVDVGDIADFRKELAALKKQKQALQDAILEANIRAEITLSTETVELLTKENLL